MLSAHPPLTMYNFSLSIVWQSSSVEGGVLFHEPLSTLDTDNLKTFIACKIHSVRTPLVWKSICTHGRERYWREHVIGAPHNIWPKRGSSRKGVHSSSWSQEKRRARRPLRGKRGKQRSSLLFTVLYNFSIFHHFCLAQTKRSG